jgi:hypothetical protein
MRFVLAGTGAPMDDLAVARRLRVRVDGDHAVVAVGHALDAERPHIDIVFLSRHLGQEGRLAGLVGAGRRGSAAEKHQ